MPGPYRSVKTPATPLSQVYLCVGLTTGATLLLELALTRIFSVVFYYHFAFLAISIALFGLGAGGVFSYVVAGWKAPLFARLGRLSAINSFFVLLALGVILAQKNNPSNWDIALIYFTTALPFFLAGGPSGETMAFDAITPAEWNGRQAQYPLDRLHPMARASLRFFRRPECAHAGPGRSRRAEPPLRRGGHTPPLRTVRPGGALHGPAVPGKRDPRLF